jgi:predicted Zn-dependent peptidase
MYRKTVLDNGIRVISERLDHFRSVSLGIWVGVGSRDEAQKENGISHFIEHMIFKGTNTRTSLQIAKELDAIGGLCNAFTGSEYTCFHSRVLDKHFQTLADILSDIFLHSTFDPQEMNRERQVILQEINMLEDTPDENIHVLFNEFFFMNHPLGMPVMGTPQTVSAIEKETILAHIKRFHTPQQILLVAAGNVNHEELVDCFKPLFENLGPEEANQNRSVPEIHAGILSQPKDLEQVHICLGGKGPHLSGERRFAAAILNTILGGNMSSRLFQEIREKRGLAYSVYAFLTSYMDTGMLGIYLGTDPKEVNQALQVISREIRKIQGGDITNSDLAATKEHLIGSILLGAESTDSRMMRLAKNEYVFGRDIPFEEVEEELDKVRVDEIVAVAREIFKTGDVSLATLGPFKKEDLDLSCLDFNGGS